MKLTPLKRPLSGNTDFLLQCFDPTCSSRSPCRGRRSASSSSRRSERFAALFLSRRQHEVGGIHREQRMPECPLINNENPGQNSQNVLGNIREIYLTFRLFYKANIHIEYVFLIFYSSEHQLLMISASKTTFSFKNSKTLVLKFTKIFLIGPFP